MLLIDFSHWPCHPEFARGWALLGVWVKSNPNARMIVPAAVLRRAFHGESVPLSDAISLMGALEWLTVRGKLKRRFAVVSPDGTVLAPYYQTRKEIPSQVRNAFDEVIDTSVSDIEPVFLAVGYGE